MHILCRRKRARVASNNEVTASVLAFSKGRVNLNVEMIVG